MEMLSEERCLITFPEHRIKKNRGNLLEVRKDKQSNNFEETTADDMTMARGKLSNSLKDYTVKSHNITTKK